MAELNKEAFIKLAEAYIKQEKYEKEVDDIVEFVHKKHSVDRSFIGSPISSEIIMEAVEDLLGEGFCYYFYDCRKDFNEFNRRNFLPDRTHPNIKNFGELWEFSQRQDEK